MTSDYATGLKQRGSAIIYVVLAIIILSASAGAMFFKVKPPPQAGQEMNMPEAAPETGLVSAAVLPEVTVYKSATCGCCAKWVTHLESEGFKVVTHNRDDMNTVKSDAGLQPEFASCHTAFVDGYVIEGHVPADDIKRLLIEKPAVLGLTAPGMPQKSPGMQAEGLSPKGFDVLAFEKNGNSHVFSQY